MFKEVICYFKYNFGWFPLICAFLFIDKNLAFKIPFLFTIDYIILIAIPLYLLSKAENTNLDTLSIVFLLTLLLSLLLNRVNPVFHAYERYVLFCLLLLSFSPLIQSIGAVNFRMQVFVLILWGSVVISFLSFFCYFLGINFMSIQSNSYLEYKAGTFGGITTQSMALAPISGIAVIFLVYLALNTHKIIYWIVAACCFATLMFAASRSAFIATIIGVLALIYYNSFSKANALKTLLPIIIVVCISYPLWNFAMEGLIQKNRSELSMGIDTTSRQGKWDARIDEFKDSPLIGIGFATVSERTYYDKNNGIIEPGSSWLAILSMTGSLGLILFCCIYFRGLRNGLMSISRANNVIGCILIMLGIHMIAEGHIFSAGSYLCFMVWITIGVATDSKIFDIQTLLPQYCEEAY